MGLMFWRQYLHLKSALKLAGETDYKQEKPQGHYTPPLSSLASGCKIWAPVYGHKYKWCSGSLPRISVWPSENWESGASVRQNKQTNKQTNKQKTGAFHPAFVLPSPRVQNILRSLKIQAQVV